MKSSTLIVSYLWKDTWKRWCEQPGSPLARLFVTGLLTAVAAMVLTAFQLIEHNLRQRLERTGLDTLIVREPVTVNSPGYFRHEEGPDSLAILNTSGRKLRLRQLFLRGETEWHGNNLPVFAYPPEALPSLAEMLSPQTAAVCASDEMPPGALVRARVGHRSVVAAVARPPNWLRALTQGDFLLVPQGWLPEEESLGWIETTVFQRGPAAPSMEKIIEAVNTLSLVEQHSPPQIQSALPLLRELDELHRRHQQWRGALAGILGAAVALVYGALAVLEFRQNLFVSALLRSFGAPSWILFLRHWLENMALANIAALAAIFFVAGLHRELFGTFGLAPEIVTANDPGFFSGANLTALLWINVGAVLSSLPVAVGLRQPVGEILS